MVEDVLVLVEFTNDGYEAHVVLILVVVEDVLVPQKLGSKLKALHES